MTGKVDLRIRVAALDIEQANDLRRNPGATLARKSHLYLKCDDMRYRTNTAVEVSLMSKPEYEISTPATQCPTASAAPADRRNRRTNSLWLKASLMVTIEEWTNPCRPKLPPTWSAKIKPVQVNGAAGASLMLRRPFASAPVAANAMAAPAAKPRTAVWNFFMTTQPSRYPNSSSPTPQCTRPKLCFAGSSEQGTATDCRFRDVACGSQMSATQMEIIIKSMHYCRWSSSTWRLQASSCVQATDMQQNDKSLPADCAEGPAPA